MMEEHALQTASELASPPLFVDRVREHARQQPDALAIRAPGGERTFAELARRSERIAARLRGSGCTPGDRVVVIGRPSIEWLDVMIGAMFARYAFTPLSTALTVDEQTRLLVDASPRLVFADREFAEACPFPPDRKIVLESLESWIEAGESVGEPAQPGGEDVFSIIYSSGTTGTPKGIAHSARARAAFVAARLRAGPGHVTLLSTALYTNFSFLGIVGPLYHGGSVSVLGKFSVAAFLHATRTEKITDTSLVPVQMRRILEHPDFDPAALASLHFTMLSGSPVDPAMKAQIVEIWPGQIVDSYGTTETGGIATLNLKAFPDKLDTVGQLMTGVELVILDEDDSPLPSGQIGEIAARTPLPMDGYYNREQSTAKAAWHDAGGRRFLRTGDVGRLGEDGFLRITGRAKDMIISGGLNIYACDIEDALCAHAAVSEVAVIAVPDPHWGERPYAIVVLRKEAEVTAEDLLGALEGRLARTSRPVGLEFITALPRNDMGKVLKRVLREPFWKHHKTEIA